jgi:ABC-type polysaccharide transport system permease subunit
VGHRNAQGFQGGVLVRAAAPNHGHFPQKGQLIRSVTVYEQGIQGLKYSLTTAVGLFQSVVAVIFILATNTLAKRMGERGIM